MYAATRCHFCVFADVILLEGAAAQANDPNEDDLQQAKDLVMMHASLTRDTATAASAKLSSEVKELHNHNSKSGKAMDKILPVSEVEVPVKHYDKSVVNEAVARHLFSEGYFDAARSFVEEAQVAGVENLQENFQEMYKMLHALRQRDVEPALAWVHLHADQFPDHALEFLLLRLQFISIVKEQRVLDALRFAQTKFVGAIAEHRESQIAPLMTMLLYVRRLENSPYASLVSDSIWDEASISLSSAHCRLLGLSDQSPLDVTIHAGSLAVPKLLKFASIQKSDWTSLEQLPIDVELGSAFRFHSIFVCPVSKEVVTKDNPPQLLPCGHVISKTSMDKLARGYSRFKCPYCPNESSKELAITLFF